METITTAEIEQLKDTVVEEAKAKIDPLEGDALAAMAEGPGWKAMMRKANKTILSLLEPIDSNDVTSESNLMLIGANTLANAKAIKVLREFVNHAESEKNARRAIAKQKEVSEPEA